MTDIRDLLGPDGTFDAGYHPREPTFWCWEGVSSDGGRVSYPAFHELSRAQEDLDANRARDDQSGRYETWLLARFESHLVMSIEAEVRDGEVVP